MLKTLGARLRRSLGLAVFFLLLLAAFSHASQGDEKKLRAAEEAVGRSVGDYALVDQDGNGFKLSRYFGKPLVVSFIYTRCGHICPTLTMSLKAALEEAGAGLGAKFNVLTVGFDAENDTPEALKAYGCKFAADFKSWKFAAADKETLDSMARDIGFYYERTNRGFDHLNMVSIVGRDGKVYKQVYGINFSSEEILEPIDYSLLGIPPKATPGVIDKLKLFCFTYDPITGEYKPDYGMFMRLFLIAAAQAALLFFVIYLFKSAREADKKTAGRREVELKNKISIF